MLSVLNKRVFDTAPIFADQIGLTEAELVDWRAQAAERTEWWEWFDGTKLQELDEEEPGKGGEGTLRYPLQLNPASQAARLHAYALAGEVPDTSDPLVRTVVEPRREGGDEPTKAAKDSARHAEQVLSDVEYENHSRSMDTDAFLAIQALGAMIIKVGWEPNNSFLPTGIRYEYIDPRNFWCHWSGSNYWELDAAWVKYTISQADALGYGVQTASTTATYVEYWSRDRYWIKIDGKFALDEAGQPYNRTHDFGFVPFIYVPHERANDFWGRSLIPEAVGLIKELNSRLADAGDAMHLGVHSLVTGRNLKSGYPVEKTLPNGQPYIDLGRAISQGDPQPEMTRVDAPELPASAADFNSKVLEHVRIAFQTPEIAYGKEEGTQRSGQTLYNRMWPLLAHVRTERTHWTEARNLRAEMTLKILSLKKRAGITSEHLGLRKRQLWAPMVPVDRAALVDELIRRKQEDGISLPHFVEAFGDVSDVEAEVKAIWADVKRMLDLESRVELMKAEKEMELKEKEMSITLQQGEQQLELDERRMNMQLEGQQAKLEMDKERAKLPQPKPAGGASGGARK